jgi:small subunit ribosomal protein S6
MSASSPTYDLVILLDPDAEEPARAKIIADARAAIDASGEVLRHDAWGNRALSYPIQRRSSAEYHLLQFRAANPELLSRLNRSLRITDGILRFRIIKLKPGVPEPPDMATPGTVSVAAGTDTDSDSSASASGGQPASSGGSQGSAGVSSGGDAAASASDAAASASDVVTGGATQAPEPGAAGSAEAAEQVQAGST